MCLDTNVLKAHQKTKSLNRPGFLTTRPLDVLTSGRLGCTLADEAPSIIALEGFAICCGLSGSAPGDPALRSSACVTRALDPALAHQASQLYWDLSLYVGVCGFYSLR